MLDPTPVRLDPSSLTLDPTSARLVPTTLMRLDPTQLEIFKPQFFAVRFLESTVPLGQDVCIEGLNYS